MFCFAVLGFLEKLCFQGVCEDKAMQRCDRVEKEVGEKSGIWERCTNRTAGDKVSRCLLSPASS